MEGGPIYAISTGLQASSRLLSAATANCLAVLPAAADKENPWYCSDGSNTQAFLLGNVLLKTKKEI